MDHAAKILLLGKTGVGKSSFINYFLGTDVAKTGVGKPITQELTCYEFSNGKYPVQIFDSKGLEALEANNQIENIINEVKKRNNSGNVFDWFHTIFYCVSMGYARFEDFEANFIRRLKSEIGQNIYIIITQCDKSPEKIGATRETIKKKLADRGICSIEIFQVINVQEKKLGGQVVKRSGREEIVDRVFELLLEDISHIVAERYANELFLSMHQAVRSVFSELYAMVERNITGKNIIKVLIAAVQGDCNAFGSLSEKMDEALEDISDKFDEIVKQADKKFTEILRPAAQLYHSYWESVTTPFSESGFLEGTQLQFLDFACEMNLAWLDEMDEEKVMRRILPRMAPLKKNDNIDNPSFGTVLKMLGGGAYDIIHLKKNVIKLLKEFEFELLIQIPSVNEVRATAQKRIKEYIRPVPFISKADSRETETRFTEKIKTNISEGNTITKDGQENEKLDGIREVTDRFAELIKSAARVYGNIHRKVEAEINGKEGFLIWDSILFNEITFLSNDGEINSLFRSGSDKKTEEIWNDLVRKYGV